MSDTIPEGKRQEYVINLPFREALKVREELDEAVWEIARQEGVEETLKEANFQVQIGETAFDPHAIIVFIASLSPIVSSAAYVAKKVLDKATDKAMDKATDKALDEAWKAWETKVLPALKKKFGETSLVKKDEPIQQETDPQEK